MAWAVTGKAAMLAAAVLPCFGVAAVYRRTYADIFAVEEQYRRLTGVRQIVPENAVMGFITDTGIPWSTNSFYTAQYALAPRLLKEGTAPEWVLGIFASPPNLGRLASEYGLRPTRSFGPRLVLFRRLER